MSYKAFIKKTLDQYKCKNIYDPLIFLPLYTPEFKIRGYLRPVTADWKLTTPDYVSLFSKWRKENPIVSPGTFQVTEERTKRWLDLLVIHRDDRILFMIESLAGLSVGHLGFSNFVYAKQQAEIDYVVRGVKDVSKGIMTQALNTLIRWGVTALRLKRINVRVFSDNTHAVRFYEQNGFHFSKNIPLYQRKLSDELRWEVIPKGSTEKPGRFYSELVFSMNHLKKLKPSRKNGSK